MGERVLGEAMKAGGLGEMGEVGEEGGGGGDGEFGIVDAVTGLKIVFVEVEENGGVEGLGGLELFDLEMVGACGGFPVYGANWIAGIVGALAGDATGIGIVLGFAGEGAMRGSGFELGLDEREDAGVDDEGLGGLLEFFGGEDAEKITNFEGEGTDLIDATFGGGEGVGEDAGFATGESGDEGVGAVGTNFGRETVEDLDPEDGDAGGVFNVEMNLRMIAWVGVGGEGAGDVQVFAGMQKPETVEEEEGEEEIEESEGKGIMGVDGCCNEQQAEKEDVFAHRQGVQPLV